ncbi:MAG: hypothetical protein R3C02_07490 [Planctomycetaceae bacterium]
MVPIQNLFNNIYDNGFSFWQILDENIDPTFFVPPPFPVAPAFLELHPLMDTEVLATWPETRSGNDGTPRPSPNPGLIAMLL